MCNYDYPSAGEVTHGGPITVLQSPPASTIGDRSSALDTGRDYQLRSQVGYAYTGDDNYMSKVHEVSFVFYDLI
jgi:hypothetical protein